MAEFGILRNIWNEEIGEVHIRNLQLPPVANVITPHGCRGTTGLYLRAYNTERREQRGEHQYFLLMYTPEQLNDPSLEQLGRTEHLKTLAKFYRLFGFSVSFCLGFAIDRIDGDVKPNSCANVSSGGRREMAPGLYTQLIDILRRFVRHHIAGPPDERIIRFLDDPGDPDGEILGDRDEMPNPMYLKVADTELYVHPETGTAEHLAPLILHPLEPRGLEERLQFELEPADNGCFHLKNAANPSLCVHAENGTAIRGDKLIFWEDAGRARRLEFQFEDARNGCFYLKNAATSQYVYSARLGSGRRGLDDPQQWASLIYWQYEEREPVRFELIPVDVMPDVANLRL